MPLSKRTEEGKITIDEFDNLWVEELTVIEEDGKVLNKKGKTSKFPKGAEGTKGRAKALADKLWGNK